MPFGCAVQCFLITGFKIAGLENTALPQWWPVSLQRPKDTPKTFRDTAGIGHFCPFICLCICFHPEKWNRVIKPCSPPGALRDICMEAAKKLKGSIQKICLTVQRVRLQFTFQLSAAKLVFLRYPTIVDYVVEVCCLFTSACCHFAPRSGISVNTDTSGRQVEVRHSGTGGIGAFYALQLHFATIARRSEISSLLSKTFHEHPLFNPHISPPPNRAGKKEISHLTSLKSLWVLLFAGIDIPSGASDWVG